MRRILAVALATSVALVAVGAAVATLTSAGVSPTTATFKAAKDRSATRTCTGDGKTYQLSNGVYTGTIDFAAPNDALDGPITLRTSAVLNQTDGIGWIQGSFRTKDDGNDGRHAGGGFWGTLDGSGHVDGFVQGRVNRHASLLVGGMSATFTPDGGFVDGKVGNAANHNAAALVGRPCKDTKPAPVAVRLIVKGEVSDLTTTSITVTPRDGSPAQTCKLKDGTSPSTSGIAKGTKVEIGCGLVGADMTLLKLRKHD